MSQNRYSSLWARIMANSRSTPSGCWIWTGSYTRGKNLGYPRMSLRIAGIHTTVLVHRVVAELVLDRSLFTDETIEHGCFNTGCVCPNCMLLATNQDNAKSMMNRRLGRYDDAYERMIRLVPKDEEFPVYRSRFAHYDEPIPF